MKRLHIVLQLVFSLIYLSVAVEGAETEETFDPSKVTVIKILPYSFIPIPFGAPETVGSTAASAVVSAADHEFKPTEHYGRPYTTTKKAPNEYGLGKIFAYVTKREIAESGREGDSVDLIRHVAAYHKTFNACDADPKSNKNVLLVRIRVTATIQSDRGSGSACGSAASGSGGAAAVGDSDTYEYFFGICVSGGQKYRCGEVRDLIPVGKDLPLPLKSVLEHRGFRGLWGDGPVRHHLRMYSLIKDSVPDALTEADDVDALLTEGVYKTPLLRLRFAGGVVKKFATFSNGDLDLEKTIGARLFSFPREQTLNAIFNAPNPAAISGERALLEVSMHREVAGVNREKLTQELFGRPSYKESGSLKSCLAKKSEKSDIELCFNQAEQAWLSLLEGNFEQNFNELPHCYTTRPLLAEVTYQYRASRVEIDWYSFLDICRYCRGTFSHMMGSGKMQYMLIDFFKKLKVNITFSKATVIQGLAFSYEKTDIV